MSDSTELLVRAVARAFADGRRILWFGEDQEGLLLLAEADVRELVAVAPGVAQEFEGTTSRGATLRVRADFAERRSSKDLFVDPLGQAPAADVLRVLKKEGIYICGARGPALEALTYVTPVEIRHSPALVAGQGQARAVVLSPGLPRGEQIFVGARHAVIAAPALVCTVPGVPPEERGADPEALAEAEARAQEAEGHLIEAMGRFSQLEERLAQAEADLARTEAAQQAALEVATAARGQVEGLEAALGAAEAERIRALTARDALQAQAAAAEGLAVRLEALEAEYGAQRDELAERRVADRRADAVRARFEAARQAMAAEVDQLKARLRAVDEGAADRELLRAERDAVRGLLNETLQTFSESLARTAADHPPGAPPPVSDRAAVEAWLATALEAARLAGDGHQALAAQGAALAAERPGLVLRARELGAAVEVLQAELADARRAAQGPAPDAALADEALRLEVTALQQRLAAVEAERAAERAAWAARAAGVAAAEAERDRMQAGLTEARRSAARAALGRAALEDRLSLQAAELHLRAQRVADLGGMLAAHERMHGLLNEALAEAEVRRDEAEAARRLADENLAILRSEFERRGPGGESAAAVEQIRGLQAELLAAQRRAADAERRAVSLEERLRRLSAERAAREA